MSKWNCQQPKLSFYENDVSPDYFAATGAKVLAGRAFRDSDGPKSTPVVMVNADFARHLPGGQALGKWVKVNGVERQIVGIVEDGPSNDLREPTAPYLYFPFAQVPDGELTYFVESAKDPGLLAAPVRSAMLADKAFTILDMTTMAQFMRVARSGDLLAADLTGGLALLGLLLAAAGLFGVSLFAITCRTREFGVRVAMGATPRMLLAQVFRENGKLVAIAIPLGWILAYSGRHAFGSLLYGVAPDDPWTFFGASALVALVACAAALYPAIRAAHIDPMAALRQE